MGAQAALYNTESGVPVNGESIGRAGWKLSLD